MRVCFDIDGTLISEDGSIGYDVIRLFHALEALGCEMFIWSGGGVDYAERIRDKLSLDAKVVAKGSFIPELSIDDQIVTLGKANLCVSKNLGGSHGRKEQ